MCQYCEPKPDGSWMGQLRYGQYWSINNYDDHNQWRLKIVGKNYEQYDLPINYCPHCGNSLKRKG